MGKNINLVIDLDNNDCVLFANNLEIARGKPEELYQLFTKVTQQTFKSVEEAGYARKVVITRKNGKDYVAIRNGKGLELIYKL